MDKAGHVERAHEFHGLFGERITETESDSVGPILKGLSHGPFHLQFFVLSRVLSAATLTPRVTVRSRMFAAFRTHLGLGFHGIITPRLAHQVYPNLPLRLMVLRAGFLIVASKLQEAATAMCHEDIRTRLSDSLNDSFRGTGNWVYVVAIFGDDKAGDVVYSCNSDLKKAAYTISGTGGAKIDTATAVDVQPLTTYEVEAADTALGEAGARNSKRDLMQLQKIHDSAAALGANCPMKEAAADTSTGLRLCESAATMEPIVLREAKADYEIKLIAPGKGSSAFYPAEVLKRDGPKVFTAGTHVYVNHPTMAEEAARPEGDVKNLAGVLTSSATYHEAHAKGPGLYARMKVFADHGQMVEEKAPHVGMSIRAAGVAESGRKQDGLPILKELTSAESVDVVTRAGAGGMILTEAARPPIQTQEAAEMTADEAKVLIAEAVAKATAPLQERALRGDAQTEGARLLESVALPPAAKTRIIERATKSVPMKDGAFDVEAFRALVVAEAKAEGEYIAQLTGGGRIVGMGAQARPIAVAKPEEIAAREAADKRELEADVKMYEAQGMSRKAAEFAAKGRPDDEEGYAA